MTEDQKCKSLILDVLHASRGVPRSWQWIDEELKLAQRKAGDVPALLESLAADGLVAAARDGLGVARWYITDKGILARQ